MHLAYGERLRRLRRTRRRGPSSPPPATASTGSVRRLWSRRAATELRRDRRHPSARVGGGGVASLTPQEREVAQLAATGLTNREIAARLYVSPRTVSAHLYRVFPKLGIASRAALRDALEQSEPGRRSAHAVIRLMSVID